MAVGQNLRYTDIDILKVKLFFNLLGLITGKFNYAAPQLLPGITVVVEITLTYSSVAVNFQVSVEQPPPEIDMV